MNARPDLATWPTVEEVKACEDVETCLRWNRFLPGPMDDNQVAVIVAVIERLRVLRTRDNDAYVRASKNLGWGS
jgi:predicted ATP-dependent serine protease